MIDVFTETSALVSMYSAFCILTFLMVSHTARKASRKRRYRPMITLVALVAASVPGLNLFALVTAGVIQLIYLERRFHVRRLG